MAFNPMTYTDFNLSFKADPETGDVGILENMDCIRSSIYRIISLNKYDIPFNIIDYSDLKRLIFEQPGHAIYASISSSLENLIENNEPRIKIQSITIDYDELYSEFTIDIKYKELRTGTEDVLSKKIERVR
jgi:phage baseplate assembly protein W